jgi:hypothetical protein
MARADYDARRAEVLALQSGQEKTLTFGAAALAIALPVAVKVWDDRSLAAVMLIVVIPVVSLSVVFQWVGQNLAIYRLGAYLKTLECELSKSVKTGDNSQTKIFTWESTLTNRPTSLLLGATAGLIFLVGCVSAALGAYRLCSDRWDLQPAPRWLFSLAVAVVVAMVLIGIVVLVVLVVQRHGKK